MGCVDKETLAFFRYAAGHCESFITEHAHHLVPCVRFGIPDDLRGAIWQLLVIDGEARQRQGRYFGLYAKLKAIPSMDEEIISRDLHRTFPKHPMFMDLANIQRLLQP